MQVGDDLNNVVARTVSETAIEGVKMSKDITVEAAKLGGKVIFLILQALLNKLIEHNKNLNPGQTNLGKLLKSEKDLKMVDIKPEDLKFFSEKAKKFGVCYAVIKDGLKNHVVYKAEDLQRINKVFDLTVAQKLQYQKELKKLEQVQKMKSVIKEVGKDSKKVWSKEISIKEKLVEIQKNRGLNEKLRKEQPAPDKKEVDITNEKISVASHNEKVKINNKYTKLTTADKAKFNGAVNYSNGLDENSKMRINKILKETRAKLKSTVKPSIRGELKRIKSSRKISTRAKTKILSKGRSR